MKLKIVTNALLRNECFVGELRARHLAPDGETRTLVVVTQEINGWAMFVHSCENGTELKDFDLISRDRLIQKAVAMTIAAKEQIKKEEATRDRAFGRAKAKKRGKREISQ